MNVATDLPVQQALRLAQLLRFGSPALPIGLYSYSQGTETAIDDGLVHDAASARDWLQGLLQGPLARWELPLLGDAVDAVLAGDLAALSSINTRFLASRETREARLECDQLGYSLAQLLLALPETPQDIVAWLRQEKPLGSLAAHALLARVGPLDKTAVLTTYAGSWLENQIAVLVKTVPLGQTAGQQILSALLPALARAVAGAPQLGAAQRSNFAPGLALLSMRHEHQYTRLFRS